MSGEFAGALRERVSIERRRAERDVLAGAKRGYAYDGADASFELLARRALGQVPDYFAVESFRVLVERRQNARGQLVTISEATVKVNVDGEDWYSVGAGAGPVLQAPRATRLAATDAARSRGNLGFITNDFRFTLVGCSRRQWAGPTRVSVRTSIWLKGEAGNITTWRDAAQPPKAMLPQGC